MFEPNEAALVYIQCSIYFVQFHVVNEIEWQKTRKKIL